MRDDFGMRIVGGELRGRRIDTPPGDGTRPTSDRAREGLFNTLGLLLDLDGARVLDLYAGSGALGLEALSRGAAQVTFVDSDRAAVATIRANLRALGVQAEVRRTDVNRLTFTDQVDLVLADPPYPLETAELRDAIARIPLNPGAIVVVERSSRDPEWAWPEGIEAVKQRSYGQATLWYGRAP